MLRVSLFGWLIAGICAVGQAGLERVELYPDDGEAIRVIAVEPGDGASVVLDRLPRDLSAERIRVSVRSGEARLTGIRFERLGEAEMEPGEATEAARLRVRELERRIESQGTRVDNLEAQVAFSEDLLEGLLDGLDEGDAEFLEERARVVFEELREAERQLREERRSVEERVVELERLLTVARAEWKELQRADAALRGRLRIELAAAVTEPVELEVRHPLRQVGWRPAYRVEAEPQEARLLLEYGARLRNLTGERWDEVEVVLLTGEPGWRSEAPKPPVVVLREPRPEVARGGNKTMEVRAMAMAEPAQADQVEAVSAERLSTRFRLRLAKPVSSDPFAEDIAVELDRWSWPAQFWSEATPMVEETAYLHGEVELRDLPWPILPGRAILLVDGAVTARRQLDFVNPGAEWSLGFGENPGIEVTYRKMVEQEGDAGFVNRKRVYERHYRTELVNRMAVPHEVRVNGRFPLSRDEDIEVLREEPEEVEVDPETGRFTVKRSLGAGEEAQVDTRFEVRSPEDWALPGRF